MKRVGRRGLVCVRGLLISHRGYITHFGGDRLKIALVTPWRLDDPRAWSGMITRIVAALSTVAEVVPISTADLPVSLIDRGIARSLGAVSRRGYLWDFGVATAIARGRSVRRRVRAVAPDVLLGVVASTDLAFVGDVGAPIVQVSDATFDAIRGFYPLFSDLHPLSTWQAELVTERSTRATDMFIASSQWAIDSLVLDYAVGTHQCVLAPTGPGIDAPTERAARDKTSHTLSALLVASDWTRKGGDTAVEAVRRAREQGTPVVLTVVGDVPGGLPEWVQTRGRLDAAALSAEYARADVLLELARANAAGVTLTDAAAHGLPVIAADVGGVASIVSDGESGVLLNAQTSTADEDLAARAAGALVRMSDPTVRARMRDAAHARWASDLNWDEWATRTIAACSEAQKQREARLR